MSVVFLLLIIIVLFLSFGGLSRKFFSSSFMSGSRIPKVLAGYIIVLLIANIISFLIPVKQSFDGKYLSDEEIAAEEKLNQTVYPLIESGDIEEAKGISEKQTWEFPLKGELLTIHSLNQNAMTFVEKVDTLEDKVVVTHYVTKSFVDNVDITEKFTSPEVQFNNATIKLFPADPVKIELVKFKPPFPFTQFSEKGNDLSGGYGMYHGMDFIYIRVPKGTEVSGDGHSIN